jgi:hypothetical protein
MFDHAHWERRAGVDPNVTVDYFFCKKTYSVLAITVQPEQRQRDGKKYR